jgi:hypothetical protein
MESRLRFRILVASCQQTPSSSRFPPGLPGLNRLILSFPLHGSRSSVGREPRMSALQLRSASKSTAVSRIWWGAIFALFAGSVVRLALLSRSDFPLNDGALFLTMARDIQASNFALPIYTSYNFDQIPFAYPPTAFYLLAILLSVYPFDPFALLRIVPFVASIATIAAFALVATSLLRASRLVVPSVLFFAVIPTGIEWAIMGGGVTRALGSLFSLLYLFHLIRLYQSGWRGHFVLAAAWLALTVTTHPEAAWFAVYSTAVLFVFLGRTRAGLTATVILGVAATILTAPWWGPVALHHGFATFLEPGRNWPSAERGLVQLLTLQLTRESFFPLIAALAILGILVCWRRHDYLLPVWMLTAFIVQPRSAEQRIAPVIALLAGIGFARVIIPLISERIRIRQRGSTTFGFLRILPVTTRRAAAMTNTILAPLVLYVALAGTLGLSVQPTLRALEPTTRQSMAWVGEHTEQDAQFIVISNAPTFGTNKVAEWFPVLAHRKVMNVAQGYEWSANSEFRRRVNAHVDLQGCLSSTMECLDRWVTRYQMAHTHVFVEKADYQASSRSFMGAERRCCVLEEQLRSDPRFVVVYENAAAVIFEHRSHNAL